MKDNKKIISKILLSVMTLILIGGVTVYKEKCYKYYHVAPVTDEELNELELKNVNNLMIVAHPDDETIWGGGHLLQDKYLIVCITNGNNEVRSKEFMSAVSSSDDIGLILNYPDKTFGKRDNWDNVYNKIMKDVNKIIEYKDWKIIVTHNPDGEYGHIHHKMTSSIVTEIMTNSNKLEKLMYFGKYYKAIKIDEVSDSLERLDDDILDKKENVMIPEYKSQEGVTDSLAHMLPYENWYSATE